jgi:hypothetical protein
MCTKRDANKLPRGAKRVVMTEAECRALIQAHVDQARADQSIAERLAEEALLEQGIAVAVNMRRHGNLIAWAKERGLFVRVDRATPWGNPFVLGKDGDRPTVIARYRDGHLLVRADLLARLVELRGKALGCWCAPEPCHADVLVTETRRFHDGQLRVT